MVIFYLQFIANLDRGVNLREGVVLGRRLYLVIADLGDVRDRLRLFLLLDLVGCG